MDSRTASIRRNSVGCAFIIWWTIANSIGGALSLSLLINLQVTRIGFVWLLILLFIIGSIAVATQLAILKFQIEELEAGSWFKYAMVGWTIGAWLGINVAALMGGWGGTVALGLILGASFGVAQLSTLNEHLILPEGWPVVCGGGLAIALVVGSLVGGFATIFLGAIAWFFGLLVAGALYGVFTGLFLKAYIVEQ
jgi:hypothetical protein